MKLTLTCAALLLSLLALAPDAAAQTCVCTAPDVSCTNVGVTCSQGCSAVCAAKDACYATCGPFRGERLTARVTMTVNNGNSKEVSDKLTKASGTRIKFEPSKTKDAWNIIISDFALYDALDALSKVGKVTVKGKDFEEIRRLRVQVEGGEKVAISLGKVTVGQALDQLSFLSGRSFHVESGDENAPVTISLLPATLEEIIADISKQAGVRIGQDGVGVGMR